MDRLKELRTKLKVYLRRAKMDQADLAEDINVSSGSLSRRLNGKEPLQRADVELIVEKLADRGAFWYRDEVRELLWLADFEDLFEELALLSSIRKLPETPASATKPVSSSDESGWQRETPYPNKLREAQDLTRYLEYVSRHFGTVTLPIGLGSLSLQAIYRPLKLRRDALAAEDLAFEERRALLDEARTDEDPRRIPRESEESSGDGRGSDKGPIVIVNNGEEALERTPGRRMLILGPAGSGKTTILRGFMTDASEQVRRNPNRNPLPIYISLPEYAQSGKTLQQYLRTVAADAGVDERFGEVLWSAVQEGRAFVCLDELDYVAPHRRAWIIDWINARATETGNVWVVGSRFSEYKAGQLTQDQFLTWELLPMNHEYRIALAEKLIPLLQQEFHRLPDDSMYTPSSYVEGLEAHPRAADWGKNPLLYSLAAVVFVRTGKLPLSRAELYEEVIVAVLETRLKDTIRQTTLRMVLSALALELYLRHQRTITREALLRLLAEIRTRQAENWNTEELARNIIDSGIVEIVARATYGYWHSSFHEYFAAAELAGRLARREAEGRELIQKKHTYSRWTEVLRLTVGTLVNEYHDEGIDAALDWLRELAEQQKSPEGDPGDLGLALVLTSLGDVGDRAALWTNSSWVQLEEAVATSWVQALFDASLHDQVVRQRRLLHMAQDLKHLCPSAIALVVEHLGGETFRKKRSTYAAALQAFGKLGSHAPLDQLLHALGNKYESIRQPAVQALAELGVLVPREALVPVLESESHVARASAAQVVGEIGYRELMNYLVLGLDDEHWDMREACVEALGNLTEQAPLNLLVRRLYDEVALVRLAGVKALGKCRDRVPAQAFHSVLADPDDLVRATAIEVLDVETPPTTLIEAIQNSDSPYFFTYHAASDIVAKLDEQAFSSILKYPMSKNLRSSLLSARNSREEPSLEELVEDLQSNDRRWCLTAAQRLANRREWAPLEALVTSTLYRHRFIRPLAIRLAGKFEDGAAIEQLLKALSDGDPHVQFAALRALQDMEDPLPAGAVAAVGCISHKIKAIRRTALQVLARVPEHTPIDVTFLAGLVLAAIDEDWPVRSAAKLCLERVQERVSPELMVALFTHKKAAVRRAALSIFGSAARVEHLIQATKDRDPKTRLEAICALSYHEEKVPVDLLLRASRDKDTQVQSAARMMLKRITKHQRQSDKDDAEESGGPHTVATRRSAYQEWKLVSALCGDWRGAFPDVVEAVVPPEYVGTWDPRFLPTGDLRVAGGQTVLVPASSEVEAGYLDHLSRTGRDLTEKISAEGLQVLKQCAPVGGLLAVLDNDSGEVRRIAIQALEERTSEDRLILALDDEDCQVRRAAIQILRERMPTAELMAALNDEYDIVRNAALEIVRTVGPGLPEALLVEAMEHPNGSMRASAIRALGARAPAEKLFPALGDSSEEVRLAAADALRLAYPEIWQRAISEVMTVLTSLGASTILDSAAYCFISDLIGSLEQASPALLETLSSLLTHSYWGVQVRAAQSLGRLRRSIPDLALRRLYTLRSDSTSKTVRRAAEDALAEILSLEASIEDEGYESVEPPLSAVE